MKIAPEAYLDIELLSSTIDSSCIAVIHETVITLNCAGEEPKTYLKSHVFSCDFTQTKVVHICGCTEIEVSSGSGPISGGVIEEIYEPPCEQVLLDSGQLCFEWNEIEHCIPVSYHNGVWVLNSNSEFKIDETTFVVEAINFKDGCDLNVSLCWTFHECTSCGPSPCSCGGVCKFSKIEVDGDYNIFTNINNVGEVINWELDCVKSRYKSNYVTFSDDDGVFVSGRFFIERSGAWFRGNVANNDPLTIQINTQEFTCPQSFFIDSLAVQVPYTDAADGEAKTKEVTFGVNILFDIADCLCDSADIFLNVQNCDPLLAASNLILGDQDILITLSGNEVPETCDCPTVDGSCKPLEARVNIATSCGIKVEDKAIQLDFEGTVGGSAPYTSLEISRRDSCPKITLPICDCMLFAQEVTVDGEVVLQQVESPANNAFLFKSVTYNIQILEDITNGNQGTVELLDYSEINSGLVAITSAINNTGSTLSEGSFALLIITDNCEHQVLSINRDVTLTTTTVDPAAPPSAEILCDGDCKWSWNASTLLWELRLSIF